jgi:hypothetical protein
VLTRFLGSVRFPAFRTDLKGAACFDERFYEAFREDGEVSFGEGLRRDFEDIAWVFP